MNKAKSEQHPITPPPELAEQWLAEWMSNVLPGTAPQHLATQAARWGFRQCIKADAAWLEDKLQKARGQELEACCEWLRVNKGTCFSSFVERDLRAARRPKPPSLAEQALTQLQAMEQAGALDCNIDAIRRALERLQELENNG